MGITFLRVKISNEQNNKMAAFQSLKTKVKNKKATVRKSLRKIEKELERKRIEEKSAGIKKEVLDQTKEISSLFDEVIKVKTKLETIIRQKKDYAPLEEEFMTLQARFLKIKLKEDYTRENKRELSSELEARERAYKSLKKQINILSNRFSVLSIRQSGKTEESMVMIKCPVCKNLITKGSELCLYCGARIDPEKATSASTVNYCPSCSRDVSSCKNFCKHCGEKLEANFSAKER